MTELVFLANGAIVKGCAVWWPNPLAANSSAAIRRPEAPATFRLKQRFPARLQSNAEMTKIRKQ